MKKEFILKISLIISISLLVLGGVIWALVAYFCNPLISIKIEKLPNKVVYYESEQLDLDGIKVVAYYNNYKIKKQIDNFEINIENALTTDDEKVIVSYTENNITKSAEFYITVNPRILTEMVVVSQPIKTQYYVGEFFNIEGLKLQVNCAGNVDSFQPNNIEFNKENLPLQLNDSEVIFSYTEREQTVFAKVKINVIEMSDETQELEMARDLLNKLPDENTLTLDDENTIRYVKSFIDKLTSEQKEELKSDEILNPLLRKIALLKKEKEESLNIEYKINYIIKDHSVVFETNNIEVYKNIQGIVKLNKPYSKELEDKGYEFLYWQDEKEKEVNEILNISKDTTFYAVYGLSSNVDLIFEDSDFLGQIGKLSVKRFNGTNYQYNLINEEVNNFIFDTTKKMPKTFYRNDVEVQSIDTYLGKEICIKVKLATLDSIIDNNIEKPQLNNLIFVFNDNAREFPLENGCLNNKVLTDISYFYNENNQNYVNYYLINDNEKTFYDLSKINFNETESNVIVVKKVKNQFNVTFEYQNGKKVFNNIKGRQFLKDALIEHAQDDEELLLFINGLNNIVDLNVLLTKDLVITLPQRNSFNIILHNQNQVENLAVPDFNTQNFVLTENLPRLQRLGYIFKGWALKENGEILSFEYLNIIMQNQNKNCELYAVWEVNPNYTFPPDNADYNNDFVGVWESELVHNNKLLNVSLSLTNDGFYYYEIYENGQINASLSGQYRYENGEIAVYSIQMNGDYQLINKYDVKFNLSFLNSNILVVSCFYVSKIGNVINVESFDCVLNKGNIKFANYYGQDFLGTYYVEEQDINNNKIVYKIELLSNGEVYITYAQKVEKAVYRKIGNEIFILSNGRLKVKNITEYIDLKDIKEVL